jgi:hypothetical protein
MKFLKPDDRFNLVISGVLKGFENANEGINLGKRYSEHLLLMLLLKSNYYLLRIEGIYIDLGPSRDSTCQLEVRSVFKRIFLQQLNLKYYIGQIVGISYV